MFCKLISKIKKTTKKSFKDIQERFPLEWKPVLCIFSGVVIVTTFFLIYPVNIFVPCCLVDRLILLSFLMILLPFGVLFYKEFKKENIWCVYSWAYYFLGLLAFIPISCYFCYKIHFNFRVNFDLFLIVWLLLCVCLLRLIRWRASKIDFSADWLFASDSASKKEDKFDFKISAESVADKIIDDDSMLKVYLLDGSQGHGKSSYSRMIVESLGEPKDVLYTYVSLTETNEENDLAKLFEERWDKTLAERYPKINSGCFDGLADIIRIPETRFSLKDLFAIFKPIDFPVNKTRAIEIEGRSSKSKYCSAKNSRLFRCVSKIYEKVWVIVFDEVDRALPREIYRLIEIIERFKYLENGCFPVKLRFIICASREKLKELLEGVEDTNDKPLAGLIRDFFDLKNPDTVFSLPIVSFERRRQFVRENLKNIYKNGEEQEIYAKTADYIEIVDTTREWLKPVESLQFTINLLANESPRVARKCINSAFFRSKLFLERIRFSDLVLMEYIRTKYSFLFDFMGETIKELFSMSEGNILKMNFRDRQRLKHQISSASGGLGSSNNPKDMLNDWIKEVCPSVKEQDLDSAIQVFSAVSFCYIEYCVNNFQRYFSENSLSYKWNLDRYLKLSAARNEEYERFDILYSKHKGVVGDIFKELSSSDDLIRYALAVCRIEDVPARVLLETAKELWHRLKLKKIKFVRHDYSGASLRKDAIARIPLLLYLILKGKWKDADNSDVKEATELFIEVLHSPDVEIGLKIGLLEYIWSAKDVHERPFALEMTVLFYQHLLNTQYSDKIKDAYRYVFKEFDKKYLDDKNNIYELEENAFYVLFHAWSGRVDEKEINKIHAVAQKGIDANPEAIQQLWKLLTDENGGRPLSGQHILHPNSNRVSLYIHLDKLIEITKIVMKDDRELLQKVAYYEKSLGVGERNDLLVVSENKATLRRFIDDLLK